MGKEKALYDACKSATYRVFYVPGAGLEPARLLRTQDFESSASTNSATRASIVQRYLKIIISQIFDYLRLFVTYFKVFEH